MISRAYLERFLETFDYPADAREELLCAYEGVVRQESLCEHFDEAVCMLLDAQFDRAAYLAPLKGAAQAVGTAEQTVPLLCMIAASEPLKTAYEKADITMDIWHDTMLDLRTKAVECKKMDGVWGIYGTGSPLWLVNYFRLQRFALGRLQYEIGSFKAEECTVGDLTLRRGDPVLCCHIPSTGLPFDQCARLDSYKRAYAFYRDAMPVRYHGCVPITCDSWLLFPDHAQMLGEKSNITGFLREFKPLREERMKTHTNLWRIFWQADTENPAALPETTGLERAYKQRLMQGGDIGFGYGVFLFDGKSIIKQ